MWLFIALVVAIKNAPEERHAKDTNLECEVRKLAFKFAQKIQPWHDQKDTFDALQLSSMCGEPSPPRFKRKNVPFLSTDNYTFYMDPNGSGNECSKTKPCGCLEDALARTRETNEPSTIYFRKGIYFLNSTVLLTSKDGGLTLAGYPGEEAWISGGVRLQPSWQRSGFDSNVFVTDVPASVANVTGLFTARGERLTRARYPNANVELYNSPNHDIPRSKALSWWKPEPYKELPQQVFKNLSCADGMQPCKNDSTMPTYNLYGMGVGGPCDVWSPAESYWCSNISAGGWAFMDQRMATDGQRQLPWGMNYDQTQLPNFAKWTHASSQPAPEYILHAWMDQTWFINMWEVVKHDIEKGAFTFGNGGFQGGRNWHTNMSGGPELVSGSWYVENVLEELDAPGEWFFDRYAHKLYLWPNTTNGRPDGVDLIATQLQTLFKVQGSSAQDPITDVKFINLNFRDTAYTYMGDQAGGWGVPSGGDWSLWRGGAIFLENSESVNISQCVFRRLDGNGVFLSGYNRHTHIFRNEFAWMGDNAMAGWGNTEEHDGTGGDQPRFTIIEENFVHELGLYEKQSSMWFQAKTCQTTLKRNIFFNGPRAAINFNDGFGGGNQILENLILNTCRESGDHGPINSWDRLPFLTKVATGEPSYAAALTVTANNFIMANYGGSQAFDNDDGSSFYDTHSNFFWSADGFKMDYGGHDSLFHDNVVVTFAYDSQNCFNVADFAPGHGDQLFGNQCVIMSCRKPDCEDVVAHVAQCGADSPVRIHDNIYYTKHGNATWSCGQKQILLQDIQKLGLESGSTANTLPENDAIIKMARDVLNM